MFQQRTEQTIEPWLYTSKQAAAALCISERTLYALAKSGELPAVRVGRAVRYDPADLRAWLESAKKNSQKSS
jgi:putative molybdopterin biosynthesis protein